LTVPGEEEVAAALGDRAVRTWPAVVSIEAATQAWARQGGPDGAVVVVGYQASPRGRAGRPWSVDADADLVLSVIVRPDLTADHEGWLYTLATSALSDLTGGSIVWPADVTDADGDVAGAVAVHSELGPGRVDWAVVTFFVRGPGDRPDAARRLLDAFDARRHGDVAEVLDAHRSRCSTLGRRVAARMIPLGPAGPVITGTAVDLAADGALVVETDRGSRVAVRPQNLGILDDDEDVAGPGAGADGRP
jgi:BirA family biotin operon repressor/biotin-[acetyl-CoA-carboxylase] ligase